MFFFPVILAITTVCTATGAWNWLRDARTLQVKFYSFLPIEKIYSPYVSTLRMCIEAIFTLHILQVDLHVFMQVASHTLEFRYWLKSGNCMAMVEMTVY